jgi:hypothetical protein
LLEVWQNLGSSKGVIEGEKMPLTENQMVIQTEWKTKTGLEVAVEGALSELPECRIVSMQTQGLFLFLVVEFV